MKYELGLYDFENEKFVSIECDKLSPELLKQLEQLIKPKSEDSNEKSDYNNVISLFNRK